MDNVSIPEPLRNLRISTVTGGGPSFLTDGVWCVCVYVCVHSIKCIPMSFNLFPWGIK